MKRFNCEFPCCDYSTDIKSQIHNHHIEPKERGGVNKKWNKILVCPNHHSKIYIKEAKRGIHSIKGPDSIEIIEWLSSGIDKILHYKDFEGKEHFYSVHSKKIIGS